MLLDSGKSVYGFCEACWILGSVWILGKVFLDSRKGFLDCGSVLDPGKSFNGFWAFSSPEPPGPLSRRKLGTRTSLVRRPRRLRRTGGSGDENRILGSVWILGKVFLDSGKGQLSL